MITLLRKYTDFNNLQADDCELPVPQGDTSSARLATGRSALWHLISRLPDAEKTTVLMPCYVAEGVLKPFLQANVEVQFYKLTEQLTPDVSDVGKILSQHNGPTLFVLIHYFGYSGWTPSLRSILSGENAYILEDFAHAPFVKDDDGRYLAEQADLALYSFNKIIPVGDGALLVSCYDDIDVSLTETDYPPLPTQALNAFEKHLKACRDLYESKSMTEAKIHLQHLSDWYEAYYHFINTQIDVHVQSDQSRQIESIFPYGALIEQRLANSKMVHENLQSRFVTLLHTEFSEKNVPFGLPARVKNIERQKFLDFMFQEGILLSTLEDKWDFRPENEQSRYSFEKDFIADHVLIPVSEFISKEKMKYMINIMNSFEA
ncbi:MAG: hypothetical protein HWE30_07910 [Methylocystaceae bacterium]|nr:hypothetical protein [Methylocystaceae bacterium]